MGNFTKVVTWFRRPLPATRALARLGVIAATLCGLALAFHVGGRDGYSLPLTALLGTPTNMIILGVLHLIRPIPVNTIWSGAEWNIYLLVFCACVAVNWTLIGLAADVANRRPPSPRNGASDLGHVPELTEATVDPLVRDFEELERELREPRSPRDHGTSHRAA